MLCEDIRGAFNTPPVCWEEDLNFLNNEYS